MTHYYRLGYSDFEGGDSVTLLRDSKVSRSFFLSHIASVAPDAVKECRESPNWDDPETFSDIFEVVCRLLCERYGYYFPKDVIRVHFANDLDLFELTTEERGWEYDPELNLVIQSILDAGLTK